MTRCGHLFAGSRACVLGLILLLEAVARAQDAPTIAEITKGVSDSVDHYISAIACEHGSVEAKDIAALTPFRQRDIYQNDGLWAVLWTGDIGCQGGSGTVSSNIAIVSVHVGNTFMVEPSMSSPIIEFATPVKYVDRLVGNTGDTLVLEGLACGENDANCCPSVRKRFTVKIDDKYNWKTIRERIVPDKK